MSSFKINSRLYLGFKQTSQEASTTNTDVSPRFLHGNSTSHTWLFSAFAELIDNAYDPDVNARELRIDVRNIYKQDCLTFLDNGNGMTPDKLHKMLSFGYCEKKEVGNTQPIGFYGNGFKSGSMRIGTDALVFTRCDTSMSVGMLSQTYLSAIKAEAVMVPIVTFDLHANLLHEDPKSPVNMKAIIDYSIFTSEHQLISELKVLAKMKTGTNIIIYNLKKNESGNYEIDFESDKTDMRNPETHMKDSTSIDRPISQQSPEYKRSLREYCSILYLKPRMKIVIRGQKVATKLVSKSLSKTETDVYKPSWHSHKVRLTFGFTKTDVSENYGLLMYHKNRLIKAYEKVGCQKQKNDHGIGVVGVVEANCLMPIHNKQDFNRNEQYSTFLRHVSTKLDDYFFEKTKNENPASSSLQPDWTWAQCDNCLNWRRLPRGYTEKLPEKWFCWMNPDATYNRCDIQEEPLDEDEEPKRSYKKTYKKTPVKKRKQAKLVEETSSSQDKVDRTTTLSDLDKAKQSISAYQKEENQTEKRIQQLDLEKEKVEEEKQAMLRTSTPKEPETSSSQDKVDRTTTLSDLDKAKQSISAYQKEENQTEKRIQQLDLEKEKVEEEKQAMLRTSTPKEPSQCEKIQEKNGADILTVTMSSGSTIGLRAPKRKHAMVNDSLKEEEPGVKVVKIRTEDGGTIPVKIAKNEDYETIDLTLVEHDLNESNSAHDPNKGENSSETDKSCDKKDLETKDASAELTEMGKVETDKDEVKKEFVGKYSQTVPTIVKFASPEEVDLLKLSPVEQKDALLLKARELEETKKRLRELQDNVLKLFRIIAPDFDFGEPENIEKTISDCIRENEKQENSEA